MGSAVVRGGARARTHVTTAETTLRRRSPPPTTAWGTSPNRFLYSACPNNVGTAATKKHKGVARWKKWGGYCCFSRGRDGLPRFLDKIGSTFFERLRPRCFGVTNMKNAVWRGAPRCRWWTTAAAQCALGRCHVCPCSRAATPDPILSEVPRIRLFPFQKQRGSDIQRHAYATAKTPALVFIYCKQKSRNRLLGLCGLTPMSTLAYAEPHHAYTYVSTTVGSAFLCSLPGRCTARASCDSVVAATSYLLNEALPLPVVSVFPAGVESTEGSLEFPYPLRRLCTPPRRRVGFLSFDS